MKIITCLSLLALCSIPPPSPRSGLQSPYVEKNLFCFLLLPSPLGLAPLATVA